MTTEEQFMSRALYLATLGAGRVAPNPMVGCVVVQGTKIVGEGWHAAWGAPHAEANALDAVLNPACLPGSTVYVNLEPCAHVGKTPPCADLLIQHQVGEVCIANIDPNPTVSGAGLSRLEDAGIPVKRDILAEKGESLNKRFFLFHRQKRPYIILKWAQTADGFIAHADFTSRWISNAHARMWVHKWRSEEGAVLVGGRTAACDNPQLNVRLWHGRNPVRITIDPQLKLKRTLHLFDGQVATICYNVLESRATNNLSFVRLDESNFMDQLMNDLYRRNIQSVLVEGGRSTLNRFIESQLWDEARVFRAPVRFGEGIEAPALRGSLVEEKSIVDNTLHVYYRDPIAGHRPSAFDV